VRVQKNPCTHESNRRERNRERERERECVCVCANAKEYMRRWDA